MTEQYCTIHRGERGELHCDGCHRFFCRQCVVSRYAFNDSTVWMCKTCAGVRRTLRGEPPPRDHSPAAWPMLGAALLIGLVVLGVLETRGALQPWLDARLPRVAQQHAAMADWLRDRQTQGTAAVADAPALLTEPLIQMAATPARQETALQFSPAKVERLNGELVALGTVRNGADRSVTSVVIVVTFTDASGRIIEVGQTQVRALGIGQQSGWKVTVPDRQVIVGAASSAQVYW